MLARAHIHVAVACTQDDYLTGTLTVQETLMCVANLRLPSHMTTAEKMNLVAATLRSMGLTEAKHTYVGTWHIHGLSGANMRACMHA